MLQRGAQVVLGARRADRLEALAAELPGAVAVPTDVTVRAELDAPTWSSAWSSPATPRRC